MDRSRAHEKLLRWLTQGGRGRWLVVVDNADDIEAVLPSFIGKLPPGCGGDILVTTRASGSRLRSTIPSVTALEWGCLKKFDAALVVWRLVCAYNDEHNSACGWRPDALLERTARSYHGPLDVPTELRQLYTEARGEYESLLELAKRSDRGLGGLPLALVTGAGALCIRRQSFSAFLAACEKRMASRVIAGSDPGETVANPSLSFVDFLQRHKFDKDRADAIEAFLGGGDPVSLADLGELDVNDEAIGEMIKGHIERKKLCNAVEAAQQLETVSRSQTRRQLAGIWELSRGALSPAAQELMSMVAYLPPECTLEEVFVCGSLPPTSQLALAFAAAERRSAPSSCKCTGCMAQRRRIIVATLATELASASLVTRRIDQGVELFPRQCMAGGVAEQRGDATLEASQGEFACLAVHRIVQDVIQRGYDSHVRSLEGGVHHPVHLAWHASLTCGDEGRTPDAAACGNRSAGLPPLAVRRLMAARHTSEVVPRIDVEDAIAVLEVAAAPGGDVPGCMRLLRRLCTYGWLLSESSELRSALAICDWVATGLLGVCLGGADAPDTAACLHQLGMVYSHCGLYRAAADMHEKSLVMLQRIHSSADHSDVAAAMCSLAQAYEKQGRLGTSAPLLEESLAMLGRIHGARNHSLVATSLVGLAQVYEKQGRLDESASRLEEALAMFRDIHGRDDHSEVAVARGSLAQVYEKQGRLDESAPLLEESLAMLRRTHARQDHTDVAASLCSLAQVYEKQSRLDDSAALLEEGVAMLRRIHSRKDHADVAASLCSLAQVYEAQGRVGDSAPLLEESLIMLRRIHGNSGHNDVIVSLCTLVRVYEAQGRLPESASLLEELLPMLRRIHDNKPHPDVAASLRRLAQVREVQGRLNDSAVLLEEALPMLRQIHGGKDHSDVATLLCSLAQVCMALGRLLDSVRLLEESLAILRRIHQDSDHNEVVVSLGSLGQVYLALNRLDEAAPLLEESLAMLRRIHRGKPDSDLAAALSTLAQVRMAQGRLLESMPLLKESSGMLQRLPGSEDSIDMVTQLYSLAQQFAAVDGSA